jgi:hypothetical protein
MSDGACWYRWGEGCNVMTNTGYGDAHSCIRDKGHDSAHSCTCTAQIGGAAPLSTLPERPPERAAIQARVVRINLSNSGRFTMKFEMAEDDAQAHGPLTLNMRAEIRLFPAPSALRERSE